MPASTVMDLCLAVTDDRSNSRKPEERPQVAVRWKVRPHALVVRSRRPPSKPLPANKRTMCWIDAAMASCPTNSIGVKVSRSEPSRRCDALAHHGFRPVPAVVYDGPGREWFAVVLKRVTDAVHQRLAGDCLTVSLKDVHRDGRR